MDSVNGVEGRLAYDMFQRMRAGFEAGGYVKTWDGFYYKKEECVKTPRGEWSRPQDLKKEEKYFQGKMGRDYDWLFKVDFKGFDDEGADHSFITTDKNPTEPCSPENRLRNIAQS